MGWGDDRSMSWPSDGHAKAPPDYRGPRRTPIASLRISAITNRAKTTPRVKKKPVMNASMGFNGRRECEAMTSSDDQESQGGKYDHERDTDDED